MSIQSRRSRPAARCHSGAIAYRTLVALGLLAAVLIGLLLWYVPPMEKDHFADLTEPTRTAARACSVELRLSKEQTASFVSQIKDGKFSIGSEVKQTAGSSDYQGCLDRRLGTKTSTLQNEVTAAQVLDRAKAYEELFREYKALRDQIDKERNDRLVARADSLERQLTEAKMAIGSSTYQATKYQTSSSGASATGTTASGPQRSTIPAVPPDVLSAWSRCVATSSATVSSQTGACSELIAESVNQQLTAAIRLGRFADPVYYLTQPFEWRPSETAAQKYSPVQVPAGFVVTFETIPRSFWSLMRPDGGAGLAGILHDYLYWTQSRTREEADEIFRLALQDSISDKTQVSLLYQAVRLLGQTAWNENAKQKTRGEKRVLLQFPDDPKAKWEDWKKRPAVFKD